MLELGLDWEVENPIRFNVVTVWNWQLHSVQSLDSTAANTLVITETDFDFEDSKDTKCRLRFLVSLGKGLVRASRYVVSQRSLGWAWRVVFDPYYTS